VVEDNKNYINSDDLLRVMRGLNEEDAEEANELFAAADVNGDGTIGNVLNNT
jgi:Ca2+-binding EF-hand superfamily protein